VLLVRLSRACDEFDGREAAECAEAIISQVRGAGAPRPYPSHSPGPPVDTHCSLRPGASTRAERATRERAKPLTYNPKLPVRRRRRAARRKRRARAQVERATRERLNNAHSASPHPEFSLSGQGVLERQARAQVERATRERLDNARGPDQLVAVLDARGASTLQVTRKVTLFKDTAVTLNQVTPRCLLHRGVADRWWRVVCP
jgi:hypothetical protein